MDVYLIIEAGDVGKLATAVNELVLAGYYQPQGGVCATAVFDSRGCVSRLVYYQAMMRIPKEGVPSRTN